MKTLPVTPYLVAPASAVECEGWTTSDGAEMPDRLVHWDPFTDIELFRMVRVDSDAVREACRLGADSSFALVATWYSSRARVAARAASVELGSLRGAAQAPLTVSVPGGQVGGRLELRTQLILRTPGARSTPISPQREGAILWQDVEHVALEGASARFPVTAVDFATIAHIPDGAAWMLEWNPEELDSPVLGAVRLLVNTANHDLIAAIKSGSSDPRTETVRGFVMFDVGRALVDAALGSDRFVVEPESFDDGTVGRMLFNLLSSAWPGVPIQALRQRRLADPAQLHAQLQAHLGVLA